MEVYRPPLANPAPGGLYGAATILENNTRLQFGMKVETANCGPSWVWPIDCDATPPDPSPKGEEGRTDWDEHTFTGDVFGAHDNCSALVPPAEAAQRAEQLQRLHESVHVEDKLVPRLLAMAGSPTDVTGLVAAVGALEEAVAEFGFTGVIHAAPHLAAPLYNAQLVRVSGSYLVSPLGHRWAFGAGYADLNETLVATGPVVVHRGPVIPSSGPDYTHNQRLDVAEREVLVTWECWTTAVTIGA
ncbi:hypothetical protein [Nocardia sp. SC052]|uniref:hypothetical protein n=1 Tax=Nocardia sichangensis TaxID=3385975 RepID=UPI00399EFCB8